MSALQLAQLRKIIAESSFGGKKSIYITTINGISFRMALEDKTQTTGLYISCPLPMLEHCTEEDIRSIAEVYEELKNLVYPKTYPTYKMASTWGKIGSLQWEFAGQSIEILSM